MRITNNMTTNKMLLNINRNANIVDNLYNQMVSGKKIQVPSDDPIVASRALKFRTNITETEQYKRNTAQGISWMEITEQGFSNTNKIMKSIRDLCVQGSTGTLESTDRQSIATQIASLFEQISAEMNVSYAGRYVFSGYRTDEPPTFTQDNQAAFDITQMLQTSDIEITKAYQKPGIGLAPQVSDITRLKLPYANANITTLEGLDGAGVPTNYPVTTKSTADNNAYTPLSNEVYYVKETGELILGSGVVTGATGLNEKAVGGIKVTYSKEGFAKGEPNPKVYFDCVQTKDEKGLTLVTTKSFSMADQNLQFEFGANTTITINNLSKDVYTATLYADLKSLVKDLNGIKISTESEIRAKLAGTVPADQIEEEIKNQMREETQLYAGVMHDRYNNMLKIIDDHTANISTEYTNLGSRMNRLALIEERLEEDRVSYTKLMSDNENVDYMEVIMKLNSAESVYTASMKAGASITQMTLSDFIR